MVSDTPLGIPEGWVKVAQETLETTLRNLADMGDVEKNGEWWFAPDAKTVELLSSWLRTLYKNSEFSVPMIGVDKNGVVEVEWTFPWATIWLEVGPSRMVWDVHYLGDDGKGIPTQVFDVSDNSGWDWIAQQIRSYARRDDKNGNGYTDIGKRDPAARSS